MSSVLSFPRPVSLVPAIRRRLAVLFLTGGRRRQFQKGTLLHDADWLLKKGFPIPAGMLARVVLERSLRGAVERLGLSMPYQTSRCNSTLKAAGVIDRALKKRLKSLMHDANKAAHGGNIQPETVGRLLTSVGEVCVILDALEVERRVEA